MKRVQIWLGWPRFGHNVRKPQLAVRLKKMVLLWWHLVRLDLAQSFSAQKKSGSEALRLKPRLARRNRTIAASGGSLIDGSLRNARICIFSFFASFAKTPCKGSRVRINTQAMSFMCTTRVEQEARMQLIHGRPLKSGPEKKMSTKDANSDTSTTYQHKSLLGNPAFLRIALLAVPEEESNLE